MAATSCAQRSPFADGAGPTMPGAARTDGGRTRNSRARRCAAAEVLLPQVSPRIGSEVRAPLVSPVAMRSP
jgi:hypothetical protein